MCDVKNNLKRTNTCENDDEDDDEGGSLRKCRKVSKGDQVSDGDGSGKECQVEEEKDGEVDKDIDWMSLPKEVWSRIFQWIPSRDKVTSRLVSKDWKQNIDSLSSYAVHLHGRLSREKLNGFYGMRIHSIQLRSLKKPFENGFKFPKYVRELIVTTLVSPHVFSKLCQIFTEVQVLRVISTFRSDTTFDPSDKISSCNALSNLKKLREMDITIHGFEARGLWGSETFNVIFGGSVLFPNLTTININIFLHHEEMDLFFQFLVKHRESLKSVNARIGCIETFVAKMHEERFSDSAWFQELKDLKLQSLHIFHAQTCGRCEIHDVWSEILRNQSSLIRLTSDNHDMNATDFFGILERNTKLRSCSIYRINCSFNYDLENRVLDSTYTSLEELSLHFAGNRILVCTSAGHHDVYIQFFDFQHLPSTLRKLSIRGYNLPQNQFIEALRDLKYVEVLNVGDGLFNERSTRLSTFKQVCQALSSAQCGVSRFVFDSFDCTELPHSESKMWTRMEKFAKDLGILEDGEDAKECLKIDHNKPICDFQFTKEEMLQFVRFVDRMSVNENEDDDDMCSTCAEHTPTNSVSLTSILDGH